MASETGEGSFEEFTVELPAVKTWPLSAYFLAWK
jgi:hypothetical protein